MDTRIRSKSEGFGRPLPPIWIGRPRGATPFVRSHVTIYDEHGNRKNQAYGSWTWHDAGTHKETCRKCRK